MLFFSHIFVLNSLPNLVIPLLFLKFDLFSLCFSPNLVFSLFLFQIFAIKHLLFLLFLLPLLQIIKFGINLLFLFVQGGLLQLFAILGFALIKYLLFLFNLLNHIHLLGQSPLNFLLFFYLTQKQVINLYFFTYLQMQLVSLFPFLILNSHTLFPKVILTLFGLQIFQFSSNLRLLHFQLSLLELSFHFIHNPLFLQFVLYLHNLHSCLSRCMIGTVNGLDVGQYVYPLFTHKLQFPFSAQFIMLKLDLQTFLIVDAIFVQMFNLLDSFYNELFRVYTLSFTSLDASGTVEDGFGSSVLIEIFQTDNHQLIQMINNSNNIVKKSYSCENNRHLMAGPSKPLEIVRSRKRSRSVSSISSKQSSMEGQLQKKINYKLSREHVILLIQEERMTDRQIILKNEYLSQYYNCFNNLFKIIYLSAETTIKHSFYKGEEELNFGKLQIIGSLIGEFQGGWSVSKTSKLVILSQNIYQLSKNLSDFVQRMQYVSTKICLNKSKKHNIQNAFLNQNLKKNWQNLLKNEQFVLQNEYLLDMFEKDAQKLCYLDVRRFINRCLVKSEFREQIVRYCKKAEIDQETNVSFTFQFFLIQEFCLSDDLEVSQLKTKSEKEQNKCSIM